MTDTNAKVIISLKYRTKLCGLLSTEMTYFCDQKQVNT